MNWKVTMSEGRNRQIRRTFDTLGYNVVKLHRTQFGTCMLANLKVGEYKKL
jgi:23S rRNA pseudouridine2605 synthase